MVGVSGNVARQVDGDRSTTSMPSARAAATPLDAGDAVVDSDNNLRRFPAPRAPPISASVHSHTQSGWARCSQPQPHRPQAAGATAQAVAPSVVVGNNQDAFALADGPEQTLKNGVDAAWSKVGRRRLRVSIRYRWHWRMLRRIEP